MDVEVSGGSDPSPWTPPRWPLNRSYLLISTIERDVRRGKANMRSTKAEHVREWNQAEFGRYLCTQGFEVIEHKTAPAFKMGLWWPLIKDRWRLLRKGVRLNYNQVAVCRPAARV